ncbi:hypothetical protein TNCV_4638401 [Trichonephila clavipes]|uniref:RNase H type-1 domain-containing protein n=1 Tax=Trichonephila clavipes TaxID=2585209 RepID=A0A8X7BJJ5_TRICX|nr:hypothetical protein TNCV_4638401 [Trichonephila clavipes]
MQRRFLLRVIKGYKTTSYEAEFAISGIPLIDLVIPNNLDVRENYFSTSLGTLDGMVPVSLLQHPSYCDLHFSYVRGHSGNLGNDRVDQLAKEATCQDMNLLMSVPLSHWKHVAWERTASSWNTEFLASPKALWTKRFFRPFINGLNSGCTSIPNVPCTLERRFYSHNFREPSPIQHDVRGPIKSAASTISFSWAAKPGHRVQRQALQYDYLMIMNLIPSPRYWSDEAHFWLNGYINKQNCRIWSEANSQVYVETPLHPEKLTVWCALWAGGILLQKR